MFRFYCIAFIEFILGEKKLFSPNGYKNSDKIIQIYKYFKDKYGKRKCKPYQEEEKAW